jgi:hypothetical protein
MVYVIIQRLVGNKGLVKGDELKIEKEMTVAYFKA